MTREEIKDLCYGRDDLLAVAEEICHESELSAADGEVLCEELARTCADYLNWVDAPVEEDDDKRESDDIVNLLNKLESTNNEIEDSIADLIISLVGLNTPITFNEETAFVEFEDSLEGSTPVVGVMVNKVEKNTILFNVNCGDDGYGLDPYAWFNPKDYGRYSYKELYEAILNWIDAHK